MTALGVIFFVARLGSAGADVGIGVEVQALAAAVLGGVIILLITNGLLRMGVQGGSSSIALGVILLIAVGIDVKWLKNRYKIIAKVYVSPSYLKSPETPVSAVQEGGDYAVTDRFKTVSAIGLGAVEGPEDVILDRQGNLYTGTRHGDIVKFDGPDFTTRKVLAHIGGHPLGMAFDGLVTV